VNIHDVAQIVQIVVMTLIITKACDWYESSADYLGRNMSDGVKGATINAMGSSMPEVGATLVYLFYFGNTSGFAGGIGTTAGSAVFNSMIIPAGVIFAAVRLTRLGFIGVSKKVVLRDGLALIIAEAILILTIRDTLAWYHGAGLMAMYIVYVVYMLSTMDRSGNGDAEDGGDDEEEEGETGGSRLAAALRLNMEYAITGGNTLGTGTAWTLLGIATTVIGVACFYLVESAEYIAHRMEINGYFVAVILIAAASSIPDTILSIKDAKKGNYDDALSNALGSNIFDICFALGFPLFLFTIINGPIVMAPEVVEHVAELRILLLILTVGAFFIFYAGAGMGRGKAWSLIGLYASFTAYIIGRAMEAQWAGKVADGLHVIQAMIQ